jgi:hypothetical protein
MWSASGVRYVFVRGANGLPDVVRVDTKMAQQLEPLSRSLSSAPSATSEEGSIVTPESNTSTDNCPFAKSQPR